MMIYSESRRFALLQAVHDSEYVERVYGGYYNLYVEAFGNEGDKWDLFRVYEGDFPDFSDLHKYDAFVITGSPSNAYGNDYLILKLCFMLQTLDAMEKKILGICFGHQGIGSNTGWDIGIKQVHFVKDFATCGYLENLEMPTSLSIVEVHQDEVYEGHPEYSRDILFDLIDRLLNIDVIKFSFCAELSFITPPPKLARMSKGSPCQAWKQMNEMPYSEKLW
ncbi:hypothetical protein RJT34_32818 [Clitoria ternatea]|uniref:Glutamine amidotransferase domain-containing protein n=1 Tax=Clitoria ternatea TaxID=43366 RepID=A0AAN9EWP4_CLITE